MEMIIRYLVCAQNAVVDEKTKNVSIYSIIEQFNLPVFPAALPITIVAHFNRKKNENEKPKLTLLIQHDANKPPIVEESFSLDFQGKLGTRLIATIQPLVLEGPGNLDVSILFRNKPLGSWTMFVNQVGESVALQSVPSLEASADNKSSKKRIVKTRKKRR
jgi:hypothetical protein